MTIIPIAVMWVLIIIGWIVKLLIDRQNNAKKSDNHELVFKFPTAGKMTNELIPIEVIGGQECIRYPRKGERSKWPIHILSRYAQVPVDWPLGKTKFVQATVQSVAFLGDDVEPLSNLQEVPVVSAQQLGSMIQGVTMATDETIKRINDEANEGKIKKAGGLLWVYVGEVIIAALVITSIVLMVSNTGLLPKIWQGIQDLLTVKGIGG